MSTGKLQELSPRIVFLGLASWCQKGLHHESRKSFAVNVGFLLFGWSASIHAAWRTGTNAASTEIVATNAATAMNINGSFGRIPYIELVSKCTMSRLISDPITIPKAVILNL
jgi:hypothetical protein